MCPGGQIWSILSAFTYKQSDVSFIKLSACKVGSHDEELRWGNNSAVWLTNLCYQTVCFWLGLHLEPVFCCKMRQRTLTQPVKFLMTVFNTTFTLNRAEWKPGYFFLWCKNTTESGDTDGEKHCEPNSNSATAPNALQRSSHLNFLQASNISFKFQSVSFTWSTPQPYRWSEINPHWIKLFPQIQLHAACLWQGLWHFVQSGCHIIAITFPLLDQSPYWQVRC